LASLFDLKKRLKNAAQHLARHCPFWSSVVYWGMSVAADGGFNYAFKRDDDTIRLGVDVYLWR